jgi:uncharacterized protein YjbI with pentapeptide repeats
MLTLALFAGAFVAFGGFVVLAYRRHWHWTGLPAAPAASTGAEDRPAKTLWDWLQLLVIPVALATLAFLLNGAQSSRDDRREDQRAMQQREFEDRRATQQRRTATDASRESTVRTYLTQMSNLMLSRRLLRSGPGADVRKVARTATLTAVRRLDGPRRGLVVRFLAEAQLLRSENDATATVLVASADLRAADLTGANLREANLSHANLSRADLLRANLRGANLRAANLTGANLDSARLSGADLTWADLIRANLIAADLREAYLNGADLTGTDIHLARLSHANLRRAHLPGARISNADLTGADLRAAWLSKANLRASGLRRANLTRADLVGADLTVVGLTGANLTRADLTGADLSRADLTGANLTGTNLREADLSEADLSEADLSGADLRGARGSIRQVRAASRLMVRSWISSEPRPRGGAIQLTHYHAALRPKRGTRQRPDWHGAALGAPRHREVLA